MQNLYRRTDEGREDSEGSMGHTKAEAGGTGGNQGAAAALRAKLTGRPPPAAVLEGTGTPTHHLSVFPNAKLLILKHPDTVTMLPWQMLLEPQTLAQTAPAHAACSAHVSEQVCTSNTVSPAHKAPELHSSEISKLMSASLELR